MDFRGLTADNITQSIDTYGVSPGGSICIRNESSAAYESLRTGLYITWAPTHTYIHNQTTHDLHTNKSQCCRVGSHSYCQCGHTLSKHKNIIIKPQSNAYIQPPKCVAENCRCIRFNYMPSRPEECGQWWLPRRKDFDIKAWRKRVKAQPNDYSCIGCDLKITDHETLFETRQQRIDRGASVDDAYIPLHDTPDIQSRVLQGCTSESKGTGRSNSSRYVLHRPAAAESKSSK